ncbi:alpha/beta hydrolase fold [Phytophthora infestans]|uniref:Alpha/beta hydrolase fold n=1 Tax=Phytophthora infestans TaxID=4787 RepID=A0A833WH10_PHYIN|nr:alpha/beta hydrolase fold [Phytophthora infestans]
MLSSSDCQCGHAHGDEHDHDENEEVDDQPALSLAYQLWQPWRLIVMNPLPVLIASVIANTIFVTVGGVLRLLAQLLTLPGLLVILVLGVILVIRRVASLMAYPGQLKLVIREGEANFARLTKRRLQIFAEAAAELAAVLDPTASNKPMRLRFLQVHQNFTFALETIMLPVMQSLEIVERSEHLGINGVKLLRILREIHKVNSQKLAEPCSKLCSASEKTFETQRLKAFGGEDKTEPTLKTTEHTRMKLFGGSSKPVLKRSPTVDSAALEAEAAAKPKPVEMAHPLVTFAVAVRRLQAAIPLIGRPQTDAPAARNLTWIAKEICRGSSTEVDHIATLEMLRADMTVRFKAEQMWIPGYKGHQVDAMLIPAATSGRDAVDRPVVVLCNPNGGLYELHHLQMDWIKFYTSELDCHVLVFNYRGYGRCKGSPSPAMHNLDGIAIVNYLKSERGFKKIAVHGESIGGLVATYLARNSPHVDALIADRTFSTVPALAQRMIAKWAGTVVDRVMRWETDNVQNYLEATCAKLLCSDPSDEIILDGASLKSGVALSLELGDKTFSLRRQRVADGTPTSPALSTNAARTIRRRCGPRSTRRVSEAASRPQLGQPLTETMAARFSDAVLSVGRRALEYTTRRDRDAGDREKTLEEGEKPATSSHVTIAVQESQLQDENAADSEQHPMLSTDLTAPIPITTTAAFPDELLAVVWMQLARLDGYCGQVLLQAAENGGYDKIRAWTASLLAWGGRVAPERRNVRSIEPFDRNGIFIVPITVAEAHVMLQHLVEQYPPLKFDYDIGFVVLMLEYLNDSLERRWRHLDSTKTSETAAKSEAAPSDKCSKSADKSTEREAVPLVINTGDPKLGCLLPLHCGHNKNFDETEKQALIGFLRHVGFVGPAK